MEINIEIGKTKFLILILVLLGTSVSGDVNIRDVTNMFGELDMNNNRITNIATPNSPGDAATKDYVDSSTTAERYLPDYPATSNVNMSSNRIISVQSPVNPQDAATKNYVDSNAEDNQTLGEVLNEGSTANQNIEMNNNQLIGLGSPSNSQDAATKNYVDNRFSTADDGYLPDDPATSNVDMNNNQIKNVNGPTDPQDAATKSYVDSNSGLQPNTVTRTVTAQGGDSGTADTISLDGVILQTQISVDGLGDGSSYCTDDGNAYSIDVDYADGGSASFYNAELIDTVKDAKASSVSFEYNNADKSADYCDDRITWKIVYIE
ncbi:hypothetical protein [Candidatus Nanohalovita haloferacivicina]|uniref:hypothetical protein n=1 Tax=Candidatus Nanohalovita haloferacivicina TaxID=2978046 RepID=UPI00325FD184|nr:hypothetical protein HBNXNv_0099 [Candidatus Nanohalobia archaeon BNXNv]